MKPSPTAMAPRPPSFPMDAANRANDLADCIAAATTPADAEAAASAVSAFLSRHAADQPRAFFSVAFPTLLARFFGYDSTSNSSWLNLAAVDGKLASTLTSLLGLNGALLSSIASADRLGLVRYVFPLERLPEWLRVVLSHRAVADDTLACLSPLLVGRVVADEAHGSRQLQLSIFEYYIFWFVYYPVSRGNSEAAAAAAGGSKPSRFESWISSISTTAVRKPEQRLEKSLYLQLLYSYLSAFVPKFGAGSVMPFHGSMLQHAQSNDDDGSAFALAEFVVHAIIQFWLVDNDPSPLPLKVCRMFGVPLGPRNALVDIPPTPGLGDAIKLVLKYLNCSGLASSVESQSVVLVSKGFVGFWNPLVQRPLYRYILRSFLYCPIAASMKNAEQVVSVWLSYMEPWKTSEDELAVFEIPSGGKKQEKGGTVNAPRQSEALYSSAWMEYVLSNYVFYTSLVMHFLIFSDKFLHRDVALILQMVFKVLQAICSSNELLDLLHKVDMACHSRTPLHVPQSMEDVFKYVPNIRKQLEDFEDGLLEADADRYSLHEMKLFSDDEAGGYNLLRLLLIRAENEIQRIPGDTSQCQRTMDHIRSHMKKLFHGHARITQPLTLRADHADNQHHGRAEVFTPKKGKRGWVDVEYKGDWMRRPISDTEVAWLAIVMIQLSDWLNQVLGLDCVVDRPDAEQTQCIDVRDLSVTSVRGPKETLVILACAVYSWLVLMSQAMLGFMRARKMKVNLRVLSSKKVVAAVSLCLLAVVMKSVFRRA